MLTPNIFARKSDEGLLPYCRTAKLEGFNGQGPLESEPTPQSRILFDKLIVTQLIKKFHAFYEAQRFITMFTRASQSLFQSRQNQIHTLPPYSPKIHFNIILPFMFRYSNWSLPTRTWEEKYHTTEFRLKD
jgi:hypothetical protein